ARASYRVPARSAVDGSGSSWSSVLFRFGRLAPAGGWCGAPEDAGHEGEELPEGVKAGALAGGHLLDTPFEAARLRVALGPELDDECAVVAGSHVPSIEPTMAPM